MINLHPIKYMDEKKRKVIWNRDENKIKEWVYHNSNK